MLSASITPSRRERLIFAAVLLLFGLILCGLVASHSNMLFVAALVTANLLVFAWLARQPLEPRGLILPVMLVVLAQSADGGISRPMSVAVVALFSALAAATAILPAVGEWLYVQWMKAVEPIGWSFSCLLFAFVFFGVITPIGLIARLFGYDPLERQFDRGASSYWIERRAPKSVDRYFHQF